MLRPKLRRLSTDSADLSDYELARSRRASLTAEQRRKLSMLRTSSTPQELSPVSHIYHLVPCPRQCCQQVHYTNSPSCVPAFNHVLAGGWFFPFFCALTVATVKPPLILILRNF